MEGNRIGSNLEIAILAGKNWNWEEPWNPNILDGRKWNWKEPGYLKNRWKEMESEGTWNSQYFRLKEMELEGTWDSQN